MRTSSELLQTNDVKVWAEAFVEHKERNEWTIDDIDDGLMLSWFANAMYAQEFSTPKPEKRCSPKYTAVACDGIMKRFYLWLIFRLIWKHFTEGFMPVYDESGKVYAFRWMWSVDIKD
jgi:hypothetical protein